MNFCSQCGSFMQLHGYGYVCRKCGEKIETHTIVVKREKKQSVEPVYVVENHFIDSPIVSQQCPNCRSRDAYRELLVSQGEHAGVKQDRVIERYKCVECGHIWIRK